MASSLRSDRTLLAGRGALGRVAAYSSDVGAGWGGEAFGKELGAMTIEGNWITGAMQNDFPDVDYQVVALPAGTEEATIQYTNCWGVAADSDNVDGAVSLVEHRQPVAVLDDACVHYGSVVALAPSTLRIDPATVVALVGWGADSASAGAGVVLFSIFTHLMEVPLGALGWLAWSLSPRVRNATGEDPEDEAAVSPG